MYTILYLLVPCWRYMTGDQNRSPIGLGSQRVMMTVTFLQMNLFSLLSLLTVELRLYDTVLVSWVDQLVERKIPGGAGPGQG